MTAKATLRGSITDTGGENCDERGFDYDYDSGAPYALDWTETDSYGVAAFSHQITGLTEGVTVYFRAKAHNSAGWGYGGEKSFVTPKAWSKTLSENLGLVDVFSRTWAAYRVHSELLGLSDTVVKGITLHDLIESLGLSDTVLKTASILKSESLGLIDTYSRVWLAYRTYSELLGLADSIFKGVTLHPLIEPLGLVDSVIKSTSITRSELLGLKDFVVKDISLTRSEILGLLDTIVKEPGKQLSEILGLLDSVVKSTSITRIESLGLEDRVSKHVSLHALTEVLGLLDSIAYSKNPTVLAKLIRKYLQLEDISGGGEE